MQEFYLTLKFRNRKKTLDSGDASGKASDLSRDDVKLALKSLQGWIQKFVNHLVRPLRVSHYSRFVFAGGGGGRATPS